MALAFLSWSVLSSHSLTFLLISTFLSSSATLSFSSVGRHSSGGGIEAMSKSTWKTGCLGSGTWNEARRTKIAFPFWTALTERVAYDLPSRKASTWKMMGRSTLPKLRK